MKSSIRRIFSAVSLVFGALAFVGVVFGIGPKAVADSLKVPTAAATGIILAVAAIFLVTGLIALCAHDKKADAPAREEPLPAPAVEETLAPVPTAPVAPAPVAARPTIGPSDEPVRFSPVPPAVTAQRQSAAPPERIAPYAPDAAGPDSFDEIEPELADIEYTGESESDALDLDEEFVTQSSDEAVVPRSASQPQSDKPAGQETNDEDTVARILEKIDAIISLVKEGDK